MLEAKLDYLIEITELGHQLTWDLADCKGDLNRISHFKRRYLADRRKLQLEMQERVHRELELQRPS